MYSVKKRGVKKNFYPDIADVEGLCKINCTDEEIAAFYGVSAKTVQREKKINKAFNQAIETGRNSGRLSLRRKQVEIAMDGNPTMLVWLGKNYLNQTDKNPEDVNQEAPPVSINFEIAEPINDIKVTNAGT